MIVKRQTYVIILAIIAAVDLNRLFISVCAWEWETKIMFNFLFNIVLDSTHSPNFIFPKLTLILSLSEQIKNKENYEE